MDNKGGAAMQREEEHQLLLSLYETYQKELKKFIMYRGVARNYVDDVIQDIFYAYYRNYSLTLPEIEKKKILLTIAKTKTIDYYRMQKDIDILDIDSIYGELEAIAKYHTGDGLQKVLHDETCYEVREAIYGLKKEWRDVIIEYVVYGKSTKEVCETLGITESLLRTRLFRAKKYLRAKYKINFK